MVGLQQSGGLVRVCRSIAVIVLTRDGKRCGKFGFRAFLTVMCSRQLGKGKVCNVPKEAQTGCSSPRRWNPG